MLVQTSNFSDAQTLLCADMSSSQPDNMSSNQPRQLLYDVCLHVVTERVAKLLRYNNIVTERVTKLLLFTLLKLNNVNISRRDPDSSFPINFFSIWLDELLTFSYNQNWFIKV